MNLILIGLFLKNYQIVLKTKLDPISVLLIIFLFQIIYDNNYSSYSDSDSIFCDDSEFEPFSYQDIEKINIFSNYFNV